MRTRNRLAQLLANGLERKSVRNCADWSTTYRVLNGNKFTFDRHPWLVDLHNSDTPMTIGQKSAQMGYTETALNITFYTMDILRMSVLYTLPASKPDASDFSSGRFDPALEESKHLKRMFSDTNNTGHKRSGHLSLYVRGSRSRSQLKSLPVGLTVLDELDEMVQDNIMMIFERMSGQDEDLTRAFMISTPTVDNYGINQWFLLSKQAHYNIKCPCCNRFIELEFPRNLVVTADDPSDPKISDSHLICHKCKGAIEHKAKDKILRTGEWVNHFDNKIYNGYRINQLYSPFVSPWKMAQFFLLGRFDNAKQQEFYNSKLGLPHVCDGNKITEADIIACQKTDYVMGPHKGLVTMGVDVGTDLHVWIDVWNVQPGGVDININSTPRCLLATKVRDFEDLPGLMFKYGVTYAIIDANPERRKALEFVNMFWGRAKMCFYSSGAKNKEITEDTQSVSVHRASWLDLSLGRIIGGKAQLPKDLPFEAKENLQAIMKIYSKDADGNPVAKYVNNKADHYAHARNYSEIALVKAASLNVIQDI